MIEQNKISAIIVDDEYDARESLEILLQDISSVKLVGQFDLVDKAIDFISTHKTQLVFLDIDMPGKNGFELIRELKDLHLQPTIIFTTAYPQHAIEAIEEAAFGYLLKPIDPGKLRKVINRYVCEHQKGDKGSISNKLKFNTRCGFLLIDPEELVYCKADNNYTEIISTDPKTIIISQNLGQIEKRLKDDNFFRISRSYIINIKYLKELIRKEKKCKLSFNNSELKLDVSENKISQLEKLFE